LNIYSKPIVAMLIILSFISIQISGIDGGLDTITVKEPILNDNLDGNWTATWDLKNPMNYTLNNIDIRNGVASLKNNHINLIEKDMKDFRNGTWDSLKLINNEGISIDLRRSSYTLISDMANNRVVEIDFDKWYWQYGSNTSSGYTIGKLNKPTFALRLDNNMTLITDSYNNRVIAVGRNKEFYWQYGSNTTSGIGDNLLKNPTSAVPISNENILIADTENNYVVEVTLTKKVAWQFGFTSNNPLDWVSEKSILVRPTHAEELSNGNILITDHGNHRIIIVDKSKNIRWQYGSTGIPGGSSGRLDGPTYATILQNGNTLITDTNNHRVIEVSPFGVILPTRVSSGLTSAPIRIIPFSSSSRRLSSPTLGISRVISSGPSLVSRASTSCFSI